MERIERVKTFREASKSAPTRAIASSPRRFHIENMPQGTYIAVPVTSSERRDYIPMAFLDGSVLCSVDIRLIPGAGLYHFGVLTSAMHMAWVRTVAGRLEMRYRYSAGVVYNNFPRPRSTDAQRTQIENRAQAVLDVRVKYSGSTLADLYDPLLMPPDLRHAHRTLDAAVDATYGRKFANDAARVAHLFALYEKLVQSEATGTQPPDRRK